MEGKIREANLLSRLDRIPITKKTVIIMILLVFAWMFESFDIGMAGTILLSIKKAWTLSNSQVALLGVATTIGIVIGLIPGGRLADRYGRKKVLVYGIAVYSFLTVLSAFSPNIKVLIVLRILAGLGEGAVFPIPYLMLSEFVNAQKRGLSLGLVNGLLTAAYALPLLIGVWATNNYPIADVWHIMSIFGGIPLIYLIFIVPLLPESPRFLLKNGNIAKLEKLVEELEDEANLPHDTNLVNKSTLIILNQDKVQKAPISTIFKKPYLSRSIISYLIFAYSIYLFYVINVYGPTIFSNLGFFSTSNALGFTAGMMVIGGIGTIIHGYVSDKKGRKSPIVVYAVLSVIGCLIFAYFKSYVGVLFAGLLCSFFGLSINPFGKLYMSEQYPTEIRGVGAAAGEMVARFLSGVAGLYFVPFLISVGGTKIVWLSVVIFTVLANIPMILWGRDTANISVEEAGSTSEA